MRARSWSRPRCPVLTFGSNQAHAVASTAPTFEVGQNALVHVERVCVIDGDDGARAVPCLALLFSNLNAWLAHSDFPRRLFATAFGP